LPKIHTLTTHDILQLQELLSPNTPAVILTHRNPDGDALGSTLGLKHYLDKKGIQSTVIVPNAYPSYFDWLPESRGIVVFEKDPTKSKALIEKAELVFCLDFNALSRVEEGLKVLVEASPAYKVLIDHHLQPEDFADFMHHKVEASSTCELVYEFIDLLGDENLIDKAIGTCLYTGIMTDTGSFRFSSTSPQTHRIAARLIELGVDHTVIHNEVLSTYTIDRMRYLGYCISEKLVVKLEYQTAYIWVTQEELNRYNHQQGDSEGIVNYALSIAGVKFAAFFSERGKEIRISFRSSGGMDVNQFARKHFNGGGHAMAAGGTSYAKMAETLSKFEGLLEEYGKF
jgi:phosphoesterase RecJ-like protein